MYPESWTTSNEGIFMRYSYEFKRKCVDMYRRGQYPPTPDGLSNGQFHKAIRRWVRLAEANGLEVLKHKNIAKTWTPEEKFSLVAQVISGKANQAVAFENGVSEGLLYQWVRNYKSLGYNGLVNKKKGKKPKGPDMKKINYNNPKKFDETEHDELVRLRAENEYIKTEIEVIKKEIALREEKEAARLKAKKQQS